MSHRDDEANLTISQFGRLCQLSRKALRLYDERGPIGRGIQTLLIRKRG